MFKILEKTFRAGTVTREIGIPPAVPPIDFANWRDARPAADACPTGAIAVSGSAGVRSVSVDYGRCIFCGECAAASEDGAVRISRRFECASTSRGGLVASAEYTLADGGMQAGMIRSEEVEALGRRAEAEIHRVLGRSLAIREVDAGSCNGCELEINALNNPVYDIERFGIHFVASPRHADMLLVTGPVTRNMELALRKTYDATPHPKLVVAVGACGISGGIYGMNYATRGAVDQVVPVDVYIPGCPPRPEALLHGILLALGRLG